MTGQRPVGEMSHRGSVWSGKRPSGKRPVRETSCRGNVLTPVWTNSGCTKMLNTISWPTCPESVIDLLMKFLHNSFVYNLPIF